jgi:serine protease
MRVWQRVSRRMLAVALPALGLLLGTGPAWSAEKTIQRVAPRVAAASDLDDDGNARVIVKYRQGSSLAQSRQGAQRLGKQLQLTLADGHVLGARSQSLRGRGLSARALADRLAAQPDVEWAVPVRRKTVQALVPNDPLFADNQTTATPVAGQWFLRAPDAMLVSAVNAVGAWAITEGSASITVAVLDTGVLYDHPDLLPAAQGGKLRPGYDFVSRTTTSNDGGGRDNDANDPGDWSTTSDSCGASNSSWHGTQVAGLIGAATNNGIGIAGIGRNTMVLPVRVLGRCGGFDDDIQAGMRWAGGLSNTAGCTSTSTATITCNPYPARVLNLSLGSSGTCSVAYRELIAELNAAGVVVVVASGNDTGRAVNEPANCAGALAVAGVRHAGSKVGYSNLGPQVAIAAPAGNCVNLTGNCIYPLVTTLNAGTTTPGAHVYSSGSDPSLGTSFASPIVAGAVGLMLAVKPALTPAEVKATLQSTARPFPTTGAQEPGTVACRAPDTTDQIECYCTTSTCGAGLLDAGAAVNAVYLATLVPTAVITASATSPTVGTAVTLGGTGSSATSGRTVTGYQWSLTNGAGLASFTGATDGNTATLATSGAGTVVVQLTVTDSTGATGSASQTITVALAPVVVTPPTTPSGNSSGGGGGAMGAGWVLGLLAAAGLLRRRAPRRQPNATP